jgi:hypothetical protein
MHQILRTFLLLLALLLPSSVLPQEYRLEGKWYSQEWTPGSWNGQYGLPGVYCLRFPAAKTAIRLGYGFYNKNAIFFTQVLYPEKTGAFIVTSSIPAGRGADEEITRLEALERNAESMYGISYNIAEMQTAFGRTIALKIPNVAPQGNDKVPFPLVRPIIRSPRAPIETLSVHRLFVRGPDRFEVATFQFAPAGATEAQVTEHLTTLADQIVSSLQACTASIPVRSPR